ncbi:MAG: hypothetical protein AAAC50_04670 [Rhizobium altiplani]|jgi:hypothetical protein|uniref:hypothetical protein n=1 Tax=Rhizobium TaxID=379 RepID=UPI000368A095|nr:hypothetical protein [Rhizobium sp. 42MFCr.1]
MIGATTASPVTRRLKIAAFAGETVERRRLPSSPLEESQRSACDPKNASQPGEEDRKNECKPGEDPAIVCAIEGNLVLIGVPR